MSSKPQGGGGGYTSPKSAATGSFSFTQADFKYVRRKRRGHHHEEVSHELNIVPYLDILVNLIMFLLVSQAALVSLGVIDVTAPTYTPPGLDGAEPPPPSPETLTLTLGVAKEGFYIAAKGGVLPGEEAADPELTPDMVTRRKPTIPVKEDGKQDYVGLSRKLRSIKTVFPASSAVYFAADSNIPYSVVVKTLDATRSDGKGDLFPNVAFSRIN